ncbi:MAG: beta-Ala-His dipeptidase [Lachnospiraceae bacterium]|nr:beta-Ala-His dipeptidase [Lachnospiraceae bacterium]
MNVLEKLEPLELFRYFEDICNIPHGSNNLLKLKEYLKDFAKKNELFCKEDEAGNIFIYKDASEGYEGEAAVLLQAHMDMFIEDSYDYDAKRDLNKEGLLLSIIDDYIYSKGSSLGALDGVGMSYILSILSDKKLKHPKIEALFTCDRYPKMSGVLGLDTKLITSRRLISFDHYREREILNSSAGSRKVLCKVPVRYKEKTGVVYDLVICGLSGGHSGLEIDQYRGNANIILGRLLHSIDLHMKFDLFYIKGGMQYDSIPREAKASILIKEENINALEDIVADFDRDLQKEYYQIEDNLTIYCENKGEDTCQCIKDRLKQRVIFLLMTIPDGIVKLCPKMQNIVQTSLNTGIIELVKNEFVVHISIRSQLTSEKHALSDKLQYLTETIGGSYIVEENYHSWEYARYSKLREIFSDTYFKAYGKHLIERGTHDSLECGVITDKIRDMDVVVMGVDVDNVNTTKERVSISSIQHSYDFIVAVLEALKSN